MACDEKSREEKTKDYEGAFQRPAWDQVMMQWAALVRSKKL
jgi:hypothetical protein